MPDTEDYVPEFDKTAYIGVDPMYQNAANPTEYPLVPPEQEGVLTEGDGVMVREVPSVEVANNDLNPEWTGVSEPGGVAPEGDVTLEETPAEGDTADQEAAPAATKKGSAKHAAADDTAASNQ